MKQETPSDAGRRTQTFSTKYFTTIIGIELNVKAFWALYSFSELSIGQWVSVLSRDPNVFNST